MYEGDRARKETLVEYGFRLPSALDNRPLTFEEFEQFMRHVVFVSATPEAYELEKTWIYKLYKRLLVPLMVRPARRWAFLAGVAVLLALALALIPLKLVTVKMLPLPRSLLTVASPPYI